jgi:hypothetical protein
LWQSWIERLKVETWENKTGAENMKVTVLGTGIIGGTLGHKWAAQGHELTFTNALP